MAVNLSVPGAGHTVINIPFATQQNESYAASLLSAIYAANASGNPVITTAYASAGTPPAETLNTINEFVVDNNGSVSVPSGYQYILDNSGGASTISAGTSTNIDYVVGQGGLTFVAGTGSGTVVAGGGSNTFYAPTAGGGNYTVVLDGSAANVGYLASGNWNVTGGTGSDEFFLGSGSDTVLAMGSDTVVGGSGPATVVSSGSHGYDFAGSSSGTLLVDTGTSNFGVGGSGAETVYAAGTGGGFFTGAGFMEYVDLGNNNTLVQNVADTVIAFGGNNTGSYFINGTGSGSAFLLADQSSNSTVVTGSASVPGVSIFGGSGGVVNFYGANSGNLFVASSGNETLNAAGGSGSNVFFTGTGSDSIVGGTGNDFFVEANGSGSATLTGGSGSNVFAFVDHSGSTANDLITDFKSTDNVYLVGYGTTPGSGISSEAVQSGSLVVNLNDGTKITFNNVGQTLNSNQIHNA